MSQNDFVNGMLMERWQRNDNLASWKQYSQKLEAQLDQREKSIVKCETGRIGFAHLFRMVADELRRVDPNNPLLVKETQLKILGAKIVEKGKELGYVCNENGEILGKIKR